MRRDGDLDIAAACRALARRKIDALIWAGGLPTPAIRDLDERVGIRFVDLGQAAVRLRRSHPNLYVPTRLPVGEYVTMTSAATVSVANLLVVRRDLAEPVAYALTDLLFARRVELATSAHPEARYLDRGAAIDTFPLDLHPGALRYYRDAGG